MRIEDEPVNAAAAARIATLEVVPAVSLAAVNGWRGPGALAIAFAHLAIATDMFAIRHLEPIALLVDLFFVLSGLLIAQVYTEKLRRPGAISPYIVRRFGRIWPVQAATLAILVCYELAKLGLHAGAGLQFSSPGFNPKGLNLAEAIWTNLLLVHSLGIHDRETWNYPSWSLSVEFATYVVFAFFCLLAPWARRSLSVVTVLASLAILATIAPFHMRSTFDFGIFRCLAGFFAGTLCYEALRSWRLPKWPLPSVVEIGALVLVWVWLANCVGTYLAYAAPVVFCLFIVAFVQERGLVSRLLLTRPFQAMAELSFSIYMVHAIVLIGFLGLVHVLERVTGNPIFATIPNPLAGLPGMSATVQVVKVSGLGAKIGIFAAYLVTVLGCAYLAYRYVETPGRAFFNGLSKLRSKPRSASRLAPFEPEKTPEPSP